MCGSVSYESGKTVLIELNLRIAYIFYLRD
jgi:hypothetical protein